MADVRRIEPLSAGEPAPERVWYTSYGSNTHLGRLACYIGGGRPPGAGRVYPGCRDRRPPARSVPVELPGALYFATLSPVWGGGRAFYDPGCGGRVYARAHLVTASQFADIAVQEMYGEPGEDLDLGEVLESGVARLGSGRYETLVCPGRLDGLPVLTFTAPWRADEVEPVPPSPAYLRLIASGLVDAGAWDAAEVAAYLASARGVGGRWSRQAVRELLGT
ncbi:histone deacetylase [Streptomyces sp. NPDC056796]|uniref:histone deacetylase n=1 Tax=Streptomyces sp. NPDC056796 TaxID=3345947 RepID=UPI0036A3F32C